MRFLPIVSIVAATPTFANDRSVNAICERMSAASAAEDAELPARVYIKDAIVFPSRAKMSTVIGRHNVRRGPGKSVVDSGFYRLTVTPEPGAPDVRFGKFMTVSARQPGGSRAYVGDTDTPMPAEAWDKTKPLSGAKFDQ